MQVLPVELPRGLLGRVVDVALGRTAHVAAVVVVPEDRGARALCIESGRNNVISSGSRDGIRERRSRIS